MAFCPQWSSCNRTHIQKTSYTVRLKNEKEIKKNWREHHGISITSLHYIRYSFPRTNKTRNLTWICPGISLPIEYHHSILHQSRTKIFQKQYDFLAYKQGLIEFALNEEAKEWDKHREHPFGHEMLTFINSNISNLSMIQSKETNGILTHIVFKGEKEITPWDIS